jgi:hypothetical protein
MSKTDSWQKYETGLNFFRKEKYLLECAKAERFYANDHWHRMEDLDLPKPVLPISKRIIDFKVASVMAEDIKMNFSVDGFAKGAESENGALYQEAADLFTSYADTTWEEIKQKDLNEEMLLNAAQSGAGVLHYYFDTTIRQGNDYQAVGALCGEVIDGTNLFLGNPNDRRINARCKPVQPYIIISYRDLVEKCKEEARENKVPERLVSLISPDNDIQDQGYDKAKSELDDQSKTTVLLHYFVKDGHIWYKESCKMVDIIPETDTQLSLYPIVLMNWGFRKKFAYGIGEMKGLIPNNISANQLMAQAILSAQRTGTPQLIYDRTRMNKPTNRVGQAIGVEGDITNAAKYLETGRISNDIPLIIDKLVTLTKDLVGANENALGEAKADNTSALMWAQKQSAIPLESVKRRFYQCMEDGGLIWADIWRAKYNTTRQIVIRNAEGNEEIREFNGETYRDINMKLKIDIGASTQWSEITNLNMLNNWLDKQLITFIEYLERLPQGSVTKKQQLIDSRKQQESQNENMKIQQAFEEWLASLPPELQEQISLYSQGLFQMNEGMMEKDIMGKGMMEGGMMDGTAGTQMPAMQQ